MREERLTDLPCSASELAAALGRALGPGGKMLPNHIVTLDSETRPSGIPGAQYVRHWFLKWETAE